MKLPKSRLLLHSIHGAIGKEYVIKHYGQKIVITKYPDMSNIVPTGKQLVSQNLFKEAVKYAKAVIADPIRKAAWQKKIKRNNGVYNQAIKQYLIMAKQVKEKAITKAEILINKSFSNVSAREKDLLYSLVQNPSHPMTKYLIKENHILNTSPPVKIISWSKLLT